MAMDDARSQVASRLRVNNSLLLLRVLWSIKRTVNIKSTMIKNRSTDGGNHSTEGSDESIKHEGDQEEHFTRTSVARGNPGKFAVKPELPYDDNMAKDAVEAGKRYNGVPMSSFKPSDARSEVEVKHPNKKDDPAACRC